MFNSNLSNKPKATERKDFLGHPVIRLGKSLYDKYPHLQPVFWRQKDSELKLRSLSLSIETYIKRKDIKYLRKTSKESLSLIKEMQIDPAKLAEQKKKILSLMNEVSPIMISEKLLL